MTRRVMLLVPSLGIGGAERVMVLLARGLARADADVILVALDGSGPLREDLDRLDPDGTRPKVAFRDLGHRRARSALPSIVRTVRELRPDVLVSSQTHLTALLVLARPLLGRLRLVAREPMRWTGGPEEPVPVRLLRRVTQRRTDLLLASSTAMRDELEALLQRPVAVLPNPVDEDMLRARAAASVRPPGPGRRFVYVGRLAAGKGLEDLLEAFAAETDTGDTLVVVGDGPLRGALRSQVTRLRIGARVQLLGMMSDPAPVLAGADVVVVPSRSEGMPNVALEALAVGTPVLATTDLSALADLVEAAPDGAVRLVPRAQLGRALARTGPQPVGPRPSLLPAEHRVAGVVTRLLGLIDHGPGTPGTTRPLRILLPILAPYPSTIASSVQSANMAQAFAELGHDVLLVAANPDPTLESLGDAADPDTLYGFAPRFRARVLSPRERRGQSYVNAIRLARLARQSRPDLVLSRDLRGCLLLALQGIPTLYEVHSLTSVAGPQERFVIGRLLRLPGFRGFVVISQALAADLTAQLGIPPDRMLVAHDAVRFRDQAPPRPHGAGGTLRVGYVGSLFAGRGVERLVEIARSEPWLELHLVGGPEESAAVWRTRTGGGVDGRVIVHGLVTPARARELQEEMDVLVAPFERRVTTDSGVDTSRWMSPMKVFEYMAAGRPIVISDLPVLREVLRPDVDALMVPPEDTGALRHALERLRDDPALGERLAASAAARARREFTWEGRARMLLDRALTSERPEVAAPQGA